MLVFVILSLRFTKQWFNCQVPEGGEGLRLNFPSSDSVQEPGSEFILNSVILGGAPPPRPASISVLLKVCPHVSLLCFKNKIEVIYPLTLGSFLDTNAPL
jgi:hypothetical protein